MSGATGTGQGTTFPPKSRLLIEGTEAHHVDPNAAAVAISPVVPGTSAPAPVGGSCQAPVPAPVTTRVRPELEGGRWTSICLPPTAALAPPLAPAICLTVEFDARGALLADTGANRVQ
jgi:hypothetical protein